MRTYDINAACPKCAFERATTEYHSGFHNRQCTADGMDAVRQALWPTPVMFRLGNDQEKDQYLNDARELSRLQSLVPEHFDRSCPNCKYQWAEAVASPVAPCHCHLCRSHS